LYALKPIIGSVRFIMGPGKMTVTSTSIQ